MLKLLFLVCVADNYTIYQNVSILLLVQPPACTRATNTVLALGENSVGNQTSVIHNNPKSVLQQQNKNLRERIENVNYCPS